MRPLPQSVFLRKDDCDAFVLNECSLERGAEEESVASEMEEGTAELS